METDSLRLLLEATITGLVISGIWDALRPARFPRRANLEAIDDPEAARAYDRISRLPTFRLIRWFAVREVAAHHPVGLLVDVGCGPGYLLAELARASPSLDLVGVDVAEEMIRTAADNLSTLGLGKVRFLKGDARRLPFEDGSVGFLVSTLSLHHWADPVASFVEFHRVLRPGGQVVVVDVRRDCPRLFYWFFSLATRVLLPPALRTVNEPTRSALASYAMDELRDLLAETPFKEYRVRSLAALSMTWARKG